LRALEAVNKANMCTTKIKPNKQQLEKVMHRNVHVDTYQL